MSATPKFFFHVYLPVSKSDTRCHFRCATRARRLRARRPGVMHVRGILSRGPGREPPPPNFPSSERVAPSVLRRLFSSCGKVGGYCSGNIRCGSWAITSMAETKKAPKPVPPSQGGSWLRSSTLWPLSIFRIISRLQSRQYTSKHLASVSGSTRINRVLRLQHGHEIHPFFTDSLTAGFSLFKLFSALSVNIHKVSRIRNH